MKGNLSIYFLVVSIFLISASGLYPQVQIAINEVMASNSSSISDEDGDFEDWIELYNYGSEPVNLHGYGLSDSYSNPFKWIFPEYVIQPSEFLLVWASGKDRTDIMGELHTNYSISAAGEEVTLTSPSGVMIDEMQPIAMFSDISYGRYPDGTGNWVFFSVPTPGDSNSETGYSEIVSPPIFSHEGGFYNEPFILSLSHPDSEVTIVYTLDGSIPALSNLEGTSYQYKNSYPQNPGDPYGEFLESSFQSYIYEDVLAISDRSSEPDVISQISSTWHANPSYIPTSPVKKSTVIRAKAFKPGALPSSVVTNTFFVFSTGRNTYTLPVVSISIPGNLFFDYYEGIYVAGNDFDSAIVKDRYLMGESPVQDFVMS